MEDQKQRVYDALDKLKIKYEVVEHEPVHTMEARTCFCGTQRENAIFW